MMLLHLALVIAFRARSGSAVVPPPSGAHTDRVAATQLIVPPDDVWRSNGEEGDGGWEYTTDTHTDRGLR